MTDSSAPVKRSRKPAASGKSEAPKGRSPKKIAPPTPEPMPTAAPSAPMSDTPTAPPKAPLHPEDPLKKLREQPEQIDTLSLHLSVLLVSDPRVNHALFGTPRDEISNRISSLLHAAVSNEVKNLQGVFLPFIERGFKDWQFTHLLTHLETATEKSGHPRELGEALILATQGLRRELFNR